jgi:GWxTD domain-containing protein
MNATLHFRLGHLALRQGEPNDAGAEFKWATQLEPRWAAAWFGWGEADLALGEQVDTTKIGRRALLARDAWNRAAVAFAKAVTLDSSWALRAEPLVAARAGAPSALVVRDGLRRVTTGSATTLLALGRIERLLGDSSAAIAAFERAANQAEARGLGTLEAARTRLGTGDLQGVAGYLAAAAIDDSASVGVLRAELHWIATAEELSRFDAAVGKDRAVMLRRFWTERDRADLRHDGERLREHARRLGVARRLYSNPDDQRFAVLVRHGEPDSRAAARPPGMSPNESWRYRWPEGEIIVHFVASGDTTNYRVVESLFDLVPGGDPRVAGDERPSSPPSAPADLVDLLLRSRAPLSPAYQAAATGRRDQLAAFRIRDREIGRASRNLALTTDRFPLRFERDLTARIRILSGGSPTTGTVDLAFAIPGFVFDSGQPDQARFQTRVRLSIWNSSQSAFGLDTSLTSPTPRSSANAVTGVVSVPVPPGKYWIRAALEAGSRGTVASRDGVEVGGTSGPWLVSDLAVGLAGEETRLGPGRPIDPAGVFRRADTVVASLVALPAVSSAVRVRFQLRAISGGGQEAKWRDFPHRSGWIEAGVEERGTIAVRLPLRGVKPGPYELEAIVEAGGGIQGRQRVRIEVTGS